MAKSKILIADDHVMIRDGIKSLLSKNKELRVVGEAANGVEAIALFSETKPDLSILDISLGDMNGMDVAEEILKIDNEAKLIILSMHDDEEYIGRCMEIGVKGYVIKNESGSELDYAVKTVLKGSTYFSSQVQQVIFRKYSTSVTRGKAAIPDIKLTTREVEIIKLIANGLTSHEMAEKLFISPRTVETHRSNLIKKAGVKNSVELVRKMEKLRFI